MTDDKDLSKLAADVKMEAHERPDGRVDITLDETALAEYQAELNRQTGLVMEHLKKLLPGLELDE